MAGIAGVFQTGKNEQVEQMLDSISHRGDYGKEIFEVDNATIGIVWSQHENESIMELIKKRIFRDGQGFGHLSEVARKNNHWEIFRDELGTAPMYTAFTGTGLLMFASEVKALLPFSENISEMPPGHTLTAAGLEQNFILAKRSKLIEDPKVIAMELRSVLSSAIKRRIKSDTMGSWLSGGLDSSSIAALARPHVRTLYTFAGGLKNAPDLKFAKQVSDHIGSDHHEVIITLESMIDILPDVIYQLESFDALLVRSSIINLSVAYAASEYVSEVFSGEGGDELFAGYEYLKSIPLPKLDDELIEITGSLHNTALQRVDRSASAFGTTAHVIFTDPNVIEFALRIPVEMKLKDGVEKWILRKAMNGLLPESILTRTKSKFWEGAGVGSLISEYASASVTDYDFMAERRLRNGWLLNSKEELLYYRLFKDHFGELDELNWMGRSKVSTTRSGIEAIRLS
jgi:asparagine synthase (glutamine-hydrolysing)